MATSGGQTQHVHGGTRLYNIYAPAACALHHQRQAHLALVALAGGAGGRGARVTLGRQARNLRMMHARCRDVRIQIDEFERMCDCARDVCTDCTVSSGRSHSRLVSAAMGLDQAGHVQQRVDLLLIMTMSTKSLSQLQLLCFES